jgi:hypothetical protein
MNQANLRVTITRFVDDYQPGIVGCEFVDATGRLHEVVEKVRCLSEEDLDASNAYPRAGSLRCTILRQWKDEESRALAHINTDIPWHVESTAGLKEFVVLESELMLP